MRKMLLILFSSSECNSLEKINWRQPLILWSILSSFLHLWLSSSDYYYADPDRVNRPNLCKVKNSTSNYKLTPNICHWQSLVPLTDKPPQKAPHDYLDVVFSELFWQILRRSVELLPFFLPNIVFKIGCAAFMFSWQIKQDHLQIG